VIGCANLERDGLVGLRRLSACGRLRRGSLIVPAMDSSTGKFLALFRATCLKSRLSVPLAR